MMPLHKNATPGEKLQYYRISKGWTREQFGEKIGLTFFGVCNYEGGFNDILYDDAVQIGKIFDMDPEEFLDEYTRFGKPGYGARIARIRHAYEMTQYEFADLLGVERANLAVWESEFRNIHPKKETYELLKTLADEKGIDIIRQVDNPELYPDGYVPFVEGDYGRKIRKIRFAYGLVFSDFAELLGCDDQTLEHWEIGLGKPLRRYFPKLRSLAEQKGIELSKLNENPDYFVSDYEGFIAEKCGRKIMSIRCAYDLNIKDFSKLIGCTDVALGKWEKERCVPEMRYYKIFEKLAEEKGITINALNENPEMYEDEYLNFIHSDYIALMKKYRKKKNISQAEFGKIIGSTVSTVSYWERGKVVPSREAYKRIMNALMKENIDDKV